MNVKYIAFAALGISAAALAVGLKALDDIHTTNELLGEFLRAKSKTDEEEDEINSKLDDYITEEENTIADDADMDIEDLDKEFEKDPIPEEIDDKPLVWKDDQPESEDSEKETEESSDPTGGIEYIEESVNE